MKYLLPVLLIGGWQMGAAQVVTPTTLNNGSITGKVNDIQFEFCLGEMATTTIVNRDTITQGFLQPIFRNTALPVAGLLFTAKRTSNTQVLLNWKTVQEINNKGFHIERKKDNESSFKTIGFIPSAAPDGNSSAPLFYQKTDDNTAAGKTLYRLKQEDIDGQSSYSMIQIVQGSNSGLSMQVWPVPSTGPVQVIATGLRENERLLIFDISGRKIKELTIDNNIQIRIDGLLPGTYVLKLAGTRELNRKIIVQ